MPTYIFTDIDNYSMTTRNDVLTSTNKVIRSLKTSLRRTGHNDLNDRLLSLHEKRICSFCQSLISPDNFAFTASVNGLFVSLSSSGHIKDKPWGKYFKCSEKDCSGNLLNPNSKEFISKAYQVSIDEAVLIIHKRNSSPFYKENHANDAVYREFQSLKARTGEEKFRELVGKQESSRQQNRQKYIDEYGVNAWNKLMKEQRDTSSLNYFMNLYDDADSAKQAFAAKIEKTTHFKPGPNEHEKFDSWWEKHYRHITTVEDFRNHLNHKLDGYSEIGKCLIISRWLKSYPGAYIGCKKFQIENLYEFIGISNEIYRIRNNYHSKMYAYHSTVDGFFFRSAAELDFYSDLRKIDSVTVLDTNKKYTDYNWHYDFKIDYKGMVYYIELCSDIDSEYIVKMLDKQSQITNCILVANKRKDEFVFDLKTNADITKGQYYGYS